MHPPGPSKRKCKQARDAYTSFKPFHPYYLERCGLAFYHCGRGQQFDRKAFYDGHANKFSFRFQGKKITLLPRSPREVNED